MRVDTNRRMHWTLVQVQHVRVTTSKHAPLSTTDQPCLCMHVLHANLPAQQPMAPATALYPCPHDCVVGWRHKPLLTAMAARHRCCCRAPLLIVSRDMLRRLHCKASSARRPPNCLTSNEQRRRLASEASQHAALSMHDSQPLHSIQAGHCSKQRSGCR